MKKIIFIFTFLSVMIFALDLEFTKPIDYRRKTVKQEQRLSIDSTREVEKIIKNHDNKTLEKMLQNGLHPDSYFSYKNTYTLLQFSSALKNEKTIKLLLEYGANPNILQEKESRYMLAIIPAILREDMSQIKLFLEYGAEINVKQPYSQRIDCGAVAVIPPLFYANSKELIEFLILKGGNIYQVDAYGKTILDYVDTELKQWIINNYRVPTEYLRCGYGRRIIKTIHDENGFKQ